MGYSYPNWWTHRPVAVSQSGLYRKTVSVDEVQKGEVFELILGWSVNNTDHNSPQRYTGHGSDLKAKMLDLLLNQSIKDVVTTDRHPQSSE